MATYRVVHGDTMADIAEDNHMTLAQLERMNPQIRNPNMIYSGQVLNLNAQPTTKAKPPPPPPPPPSPYQQLLNKLQGVPGAQRDAYAALSTLFQTYGLETLAPSILDYLQQGFGADTITTLLQQTPEYKNRFAGNDARIANGLAVLTPAEYMSTEASYRQLLQASGVDPAAMNKSQYSEWIGKDISPTEIQDRVNLAVQATTNAGPGITQGFQQLGINQGDLVSYFLNDKNPMPQLQLKMNTANILGAGLARGIQTKTDLATQYAQEGVSYAQAQAGYQKAQAVIPAGQDLTNIYKNQKAYGAEEATQEYVGQNAQGQLQREALGRQEQATFTGSGGEGQKSFANQAAGTGF